jgi:tetratricopeptide (TPR) repeat protein
VKPQTRQVQLQDLRNFTVQIRHASSADIVGTGILASSDGKILTCAHVVRDCGVEPRVAGAGPVGIYFPRANRGFQAHVAAFLPKHEDDVVILQIQDLDVPFGREQVAAIGAASGSEGNRFRSYGYSRLGSIAGRYVPGTIMGPVEGNADLGASLLLELVQLHTRDIRPGASGAAVLDDQRNLVVGIITSRWNPGGASEDDDIGWATDAGILSHAPFDFHLRANDVPLLVAPQSDLKVDASQMRVFRAGSDRIGELDIPSSQAESFVDREDLLQAISTDWSNTRHRVTCLVGPTGVGKTAAARMWIKRMTADSPLALPDMVFWHSFSSRADIDVFFEKAVSSLLTQGTDVSQYPSVAAKAEFLAALLPVKRFLFVLDGIDVLQQQSGNLVGQLENNDLRDFLKYFAGTGHHSFCLITSRLPILDLIGFTTYAQREVEPLTLSSSRELLSRLGLAPDEGQLMALLEACRGYPLALKVAASTLQTAPTSRAAPFAQTLLGSAQTLSASTIYQLILERLADLSTRELTILRVIGSFRTPPGRDALQAVLGATRHEPPVQVGLEDFTGSELASALEHLVAENWSSYDSRTHTYEVHPLVSEYLSAAPAQNDVLAEFQAIHERIEHYYLSLCESLRFRPSLEDLRPLGEALHHACRAGHYDAAYGILVDRIYQGKRRLIVNELGAWEAALTMLSDFFPEGVTSKEPLVKDPEKKSWLLNETGLALSIVGQLDAATDSYERSILVASESENWRSASNAYYNLAELRVLRGNLHYGMDAATRAADLALRSGDEKPLSISLACKAWISSLQGNLDQANAHFQEAQHVRRRMLPHRPYLTGLSGIWYADYLRRMHRRARAFSVTKANRVVATRYRWANELSRCHRLLGDLRADAGLKEAAQNHYGKAVEIARTTSNRMVLIEALLARGRWAGRQESNSHKALTDLRSGLEHAINGQFRLYEVDLRVALACTYFVSANRDAALPEAQRAQRLSREIGYHWGSVDAEAVLSQLQ